MSATHEVSRLKPVSSNFDNAHTDAAGTSVTNGLNSTMKDFNSFLHSMIKGAAGGAAYGTYDFQREIEWHMKIASKMLHEYPRRSQAQRYYELRKTL